MCMLWVCPVAGWLVFHCPDWLQQLLAAGRILFKGSIEAYMHNYMQSKLEQLLQEHRLVSLITQLRGPDCPEGMERSGWRSEVNSVSLCVQTPSSVRAVKRGTVSRGGAEPKPPSKR